MSKLQNVAQQPLVLPPNHIFGYHKTRAAINVHKIAYNGFVPRKGASLYGDGFYMSRDFGKHITNSNYGSFIIESFVDMSNVLILDQELSVKVWGEHRSLVQQIIEKSVTVESKYTQTKIREYSAKLIDGRLSSDIFKSLHDNKYIDLLQWSGVAYTGLNDGACILMFDTDLVYPQRWTEVSDDSKSEIILNHVKALPKYTKGTEYKLVRLAEANTNYSNHIYNLASWSHINQKEANRIRSGLTPRFFQFLDHFAKTPATAKRRLNYMFSRLDWEMFEQFVDIVENDAKYLTMIRPLLDEETICHLRHILYDTDVSLDSFIERLRELSRNIDWRKAIGKNYVSYLVETAEKKLNKLNPTHEDIIEFIDMLNCGIIKEIADYDKSNIDYAPINRLCMACLKIPGVLEDSVLTFQIIDVMNTSYEPPLVEQTPKMSHDEKFDKIDFVKVEPPPVKGIPKKKGKTKNNDEDEDEDEDADDDDDN